MGTLISENFGSLEDGTIHDGASAHLKTSAGNVEHNGVMDREAGGSHLGQSPASGPASANMANDVLTQTERDQDLPSVEGHEFDSFFGTAFEEKPIWKERSEEHTSELQSQS